MGIYEDFKEMALDTSNSDIVVEAMFFLMYKDNQDKIPDAIEFLSVHRKDLCRKIANKILEAQIKYLEKTA